MSSSEDVDSRAPSAASASGVASQAEQPPVPNDRAGAAATGQDPAVADTAKISDKASQLLDDAEAAINALDADPSQASRAQPTPFQLQDLVGTEGPPETASIDLLRDVDLDLRIELGRTHMYLEDVLKLRRGSVVTLDKLAGDPVDLFANGRLVARGEILVLNDNFCVRVAELVGSDELMND